MIYYKEYKPHFVETTGKRKKYSKTIYTFDIETTSCIEIYGNIYPAKLYLDYKDNKDIKYIGFMYIWQFGVDDKIYYGRTWQELEEFFATINYFDNNEKFVFVHNLSFEFHFMINRFNFSDVFARKSHKVMSCRIDEFKMNFRCSLMMSNMSLEDLAINLKLEVQKQVGLLDYDKIRTSITPLTDNELKYCEFDNLVVYHYVMRELKEFKELKNIPKTSTGYVRRELLELTRDNYGYKDKVRKSVSNNPIIYNRLVDLFTGGYVHSNYVYTGYIIDNVVSYDFVSSYPYVMLSEKYPMTEFKKCNVKNEKDMLECFAYILHVKLKNVKSKLYNHFISKHKCKNIKKGVYDNGRVVSADEIEIVINDIDLKLYRKAYKFDIEIIESYFSMYKYLPRTYLMFILDKYKIKTEYKGISEKYEEYMREKQKFNAIYGMAVTSVIRDDVLFDNETKEFSEVKLNNEEIIEKLKSEKTRGFLNFAWGCWVTSYARYNLCNLICDYYDEDLIYADTDSLKLKEGFDVNPILEYNKNVEKKLLKVSEKLKIDFNRFKPYDKNGKEHLIGIFEKDGAYDKFITLGSKKYATEKDGKVDITVSGVPKNKPSHYMKSLNEFDDGFIFNSDSTGKLTLVYVNDMEIKEITDYLGNKSKVSDKFGCCFIPCEYTLGMSHEYTEYLSDNMSERSRYNE